MAISLASLRRGRENVPLRMIVAGPQGIGKTTFACSAPKPVVIQTEDGLAPLIDAGLLPEDLPRFPLAKSYGEFMEALTALYSEEHDFQTLVIDSLDWLEPLVWAQCCAENKWQSIEAPGYGKGYIELDRFWGDVLTGLNALRNERGLNIVFTAHTEVKKFEEPDAAPYDRYEIKLHKRAHGRLMEWADIVGIARVKALISTRQEGSGKTAKTVAKAVGGELGRFLYLAEKPSTVAKNRYGLPSEIDFTWAAFQAAMAARHS